MIKAQLIIFADYSNFCLFVIFIFFLAYSFIFVQAYYSI